MADELSGRDGLRLPVVEVGVDAVAPGLAEGLDLLGFAGDVFAAAVLQVAAGGAPEIELLRRRSCSAHSASGCSLRLRRATTTG